MSLLNKGVIKTIENGGKDQKGGLLCMLVATLGASLLANAIIGNAKFPGLGVIRAGEGAIKSWSGFPMLRNLLANSEIQKYYQSQPKFNGVYSRNNLPKIKIGHR